MGEHLRGVPVQITRVRAADDVRLRPHVPHRRRLDCCFQMEVVRGRGRRPEVGKRRGLLRGASALERHQRGHRDDPGRDRGGKVFPEKRAERDVLPPLDVSGTPVVDKHHPKDVVKGAAHRNRFAERVALADKEARFHLEVELLRRSQPGRPAIRLDLAARTADVRRADDDGRGSPVVGHRQVKPVWHQRVRRAPKHRPDIGGVLFRGVEVRVVADLGGQEEVYCGEAVQGVLAQGAVIAKGGGCRQEEGGDGLACGLPRRRAEFHKRVQHRLRERALLLKGGVLKQVVFFQHGKIQHLLPDGYADARTSAGAWPEHPVREVLDREGRVGGDVEKRDRHKRPLRRQDDGALGGRPCVRGAGLTS